LRQVTGRHQSFLGVELGTRVVELKHVWMQSDS
jgi:hypothetical protein